MFVLWPPHWAHDWSCIRTHLDTQTSHPAWALLPCGGPIHRNPSHCRPLRLALSLARCGAAGLEDLTQYGELLLKNNQSQPTLIFFYIIIFCIPCTQLSHKLHIWKQQHDFIWIYKIFFSNIKTHFYPKYHYILDGQQFFIVLTPNNIFMITESAYFLFIVIICCLYEMSVLMSAQIKKTAVMRKLK